MKTPERIIKEAIKRYHPILVVLMVSGGHDSVTNAHVSASILNKSGVPFVVYHGDTTIGIPDTKTYVKEICQRYHWPLFIRRSPDPNDSYEHLVRVYGFPGPTRLAHQIMYRHLKERALNYFVTHECKSSPYARENVLLLSGLRKQESRVRMGYTREYAKEKSKIWANPIFYFSDTDVRRYMQAHNIPPNPVKVKICISGECLCGAFAGKEEWFEIKRNYPEVAQQIMRLHQIATANGKPWPWSMGPTEWNKQQQNRKATHSHAFMCTSCNNHKTFID